MWYSLTFDTINLQRDAFDPDLVDAIVALDPAEVAAANVVLDLAEVVSVLDHTEVVGAEGDLDPVEVVDIGMVEDTVDSLDLGGAVLVLDPGKDEVAIAVSAAEMPLGFQIRVGKQ